MATMRSTEPRTRRQRVLLAELEELFLAEGFVSFTLDDLAAELRCSKTTLYALAPSKEQLAVKVVAHFFKGAAERIEAQVADIDDAAAAVRTYLAGVSAELDRASTAFMTDVEKFEPARAVYALNSDAAARRIRQFIADGVEQGVFRDTHADAIAEMAGILVEAIQSGVVGMRARTTDAEAFEALAELLLNGLRVGLSH